MTTLFELAPTTAVNADPTVTSELLELDQALADEILELTSGVEQYRTPSIHRQRLLNLGLEQTPPTEGISRLIDALIRFLQRLFKDVYEGTASLSFALGKIHNRAELINTESRSRGRTNRADTFEINTRIQNLCVNYRPVNDPQRLLMLMKSMDQVFKGYFKYQHLELPNVIPQLIQLDPNQPDSVLSAIDIISSVAPMTKASAMNFGGDATARYSGQLLGNQQLIVNSRYPSGDAIEQLAGQEWLLVTASDNPKPLPSQITYNVFARTIEQSILRQVINTTNDLESNFGIISRNRRSQRVDDLTRYLERLRNGLLTGKYQNEALNNANQLVRLLEAYSNWLINPYLDLMALYIRNTNAVLNVCAANN